MKHQTYRSGWVVVLVAWVLAILAVLAPSALIAQSNSPGVLFPRIHPGGHGEYMNLTAAKAIDVPSVFSLAFDFSIYDAEKYGEVVQIRTRGNTILSLIFDCASSKDTAALVLSVDGKPAIIRFSILKRQLHRGAWHRATFRFDGNQHIVEGTLDGAPAPRSKASLAGSFGVLDKLVFGPSEDPCMVVRNVCIASTGSARDDTLHFWRCCELDGDVVHDFVGSADGEQFGLVWMAPLHTRWHWSRLMALKTFYAPVGGRLYSSSTGPLFDESKDELVMFDSLRFVTYSFVTGKTTVNNVPNSWISFVVIDTLRQQLFQLQVGGGKISVWDRAKQTWFPSRGAIDPDSMRYYGARVFVNPLNGEILQFGGYGWYRAKNELLRFDGGKDQWVSVAVSGERISPRADPGICPGNAPGEILLFGGFGNESGAQSDGFRGMFDLWLLDLHDYRFTKLWQGGSIESSAGGMFAARVPGDSDIYAIVREDKVADKKSYLIVLSPSSGRLTGFADTLRGSPPGLLGYDRYNARFVTVVQKERTDDSVEVFLGTLAYPPLSEHELRRAIIAATERGGSKEMFAAIAFLIIGVAGVTIYRMRKSNRPQTLPQTDSGVLLREAPGHSAQVSIRVFGDLQIVDIQGNERAHELSPKLKELFLLVLLHSGGNGSRTVSTERMTSILWPESDRSSAKNSRGVSVNRLREYLSTIGTIELIYSDERWRIDLGAHSSCDYFDYLRLLELLKRCSELERPGYLQELVNTVKAGSLLRELSYEWLDPIKADILQRTVSLLVRELALIPFEKLPTLSLGIQDAVLLWDPLNEEAVRFKVRHLENLGQHGLARSVFNRFTSEYEKAYDKPFGRPFNDFLEV